MTERYTAVGWTDDETVMWQCDDCGAAIVDRDTHNDFHTSLAYLRVMLGELYDATATL